MNFFDCKTKCKPTKEFWEHLLNAISQIQQQLNNRRWTPECEHLLQRIERQARALANIVKGKPNANT